MPRINNKLFYESSLKKHGATAKGVHWNSKQNQYKRFEILTQYIKDDLANSTVCDAGCGVGEYYNFLKDSNLKPQKYIGIDIEKSMLDIAKSNLPDIEFLQNDILNDKIPKADYYICSGGMNILTHDEMFLFIKNIFNNSKKGAVFNMLDNNHVTNKDIYNSFSLFDMLLFCKELTNNVAFRSDYLEGDFTIFLKKEF